MSESKQKGKDRKCRVKEGKDIKKGEKSGAHLGK